MQNRYKSKVLWVAVAANLFAMLTLTGLDRAIGIDMGVVGDVVAIVLDTLVIFGVLNDPTNKKGF
jgi:uncharacterized membrane protein